MRHVRYPILIALMLAVAAPSYCIPAFARKYGFNCEMCHVTWPKLNDFGQQFRMNGYQIPGQEGSEKTILEMPGIPLSMRTQAGYTSDSFSPQGAEDETNQFQINGLDVLGAGLLGPNKGFFLAYLPQITGGSGVEAQDAELEQANVMFSRLRSTWLNARVGRFEGAQVAFSAVRSITLSPYEIYEFDGSPGVSAAGTAGSLNTFSLANPNAGIELTGWGRSPLQYAFGFVNGSSENGQDDSPADLYVRGAYVFGPGLGQTYGQRVGLTGHFGKARPAGGGKRQSFNRLGFDANLNKGPYNAEFQWISGQDNREFNIFDPTKNYKFSGGFLQLNHFEMGGAKFLRYDWVNTPSEDNHDITRFTLGWRHHLAHPMALQLEYSHRKVNNGAGPGSDLTENFVAARVDWAF
jgi:hypothetical protein